MVDVGVRLFTGATFSQIWLGTGHRYDESFECAHGR